MDIWGGGRGVQFLESKKPSTPLTFMAPPSVKYKNLPVPEKNLKRKAARLSTILEARLTRCDAW